MPFSRKGTPSGRSVSIKVCIDEGFESVRKALYGCPSSVGNELTSLVEGDSYWRDFHGLPGQPFF
jgi:hypothetical protein